jgi:hypothetical protein
MTTGTDENISHLKRSLLTVFHNVSNIARIKILHLYQLLQIYNIHLMRDLHEGGVMQHCCGKIKNKGGRVRVNTMTPEM